MTRRLYLALEGFLGCLAAAAAAAAAAGRFSQARAVVIESRCAVHAATNQLAG
jgi:hypothetical protein